MCNAACGSLQHSNKVQHSVCLHGCSGDVSVQSALYVSATGADMLVLHMVFAYFVGACCGFAVCRAPHAECR